MYNKQTVAGHFMSTRLPDYAETTQTMVAIECFSPEKMQIVTPHATWNVLLLSSSRRTRLPVTWQKEKESESQNNPHSAWQQHVFESSDNFSLQTQHLKQHIYAMCIYATAQTCHKCINIRISQSLTRWDPRRKVRSDLHIGSSTRLQLKFKTEADARLMQRPSWRNTYTWVRASVFTLFNVKDPENDTKAAVPEI